MNPKKNEEFHLEDFIPYQLSVLSNTVARNLAGAYQERFGISITEWRIIAVLRRYPRLSAAEVSDKTALDGPAISRGVFGLVRLGVLTRKTAPLDRRKIVLTLTAKGRRIFAQLEPLILLYQEELLSAITSEQCKTLEAVLPKLIEKARALGSPNISTHDSNNKKQARKLG